ncbi:MAG: DUF1573 domain-containing protein [Limisphaerales bacterium]
MSRSQASVALILCGLTIGPSRLTAQPGPPSPPAAAIPAQASPAPQSASAGPLIEFDQKDYNWGKVESGDLVKHVFTVSNAGTGTLIISNVHPSCGCTTAGAWTTNIEAGKTGSLPIQFNSARYSSPSLITKTIEVFSNAKNHPRETLFLRGIARRSIEANPPTPIINVVAGTTSNVSTTVRLTCQSTQPVELSNPVSSSKSFAAELETVTPGKEYKLVVTALPPFAIGSVSTTVSLKTTLITATNFDLNVVASVQPEIQVSPPQLRLGALPSVWTTNRGVFIHGNGPARLTLSDPECTDPRIHVQINPIGVQNIYNLLVAFPPNYQIEQGKGVEITVKSDNPRTPIVKVPIVQFMRGSLSSLPGRATHPAQPPVGNP